MKIYLKIVSYMAFMLCSLNFIPQLISSNYDELFIGGITLLIIIPIVSYYWIKSIINMEKNDEK